MLTLDHQSCGTFTWLLYEREFVGQPVTNHLETVVCVGLCCSDNIDLNGEVISTERMSITDYHSRSSV